MGSEASNVALTISNSIIFLVVIAGIIYLFVGAFLNARREVKGKPKVKRTSMIIVVSALIALAVASFFVINSATPQVRADKYNVLLRYNGPNKPYRIEGRDFDTEKECRERMASLNFNRTEVESTGSFDDLFKSYRYYCGKNCEKASDGVEITKCEEILE